MKNFCQSEFVPKPSYLHLVPIVYTDIDGRSRNLSHRMPWGDEYDENEYLHSLASIRRNTPFHLPDDWRRALDALDKAGSNLFKLESPYQREREVRLFIYSEGFSEEEAGFRNSEGSFRYLQDTQERHHNKYQKFIIDLTYPLFIRLLVAVNF